MIEVRDVVLMAGDSIAPAYRATLADGSGVFVKSDPPEDMERLKAEARGPERP